MIIEYKGKTLNTKNYVEITEEERKEISNGYFELPPFEEVQKQIHTLSGGGVKIDKITHYYFRKLMAQV